MRQSHRKLLTFFCFFATILMGCETEDQVLPKVFTIPPHEITRYSAQSGGEVVQEGTHPVMTRGVCWNSFGQPTIMEDTTLNGQGPGTFQSNMLGLLPNITYFVRAYSISSAGIAYGEEQSFRTNTIPEYLNSQLHYEQITDRDGNYYYTIVIGQQVWMAQNLRTTRFANGDRIDHVPDYWVGNHLAAWCYPNNNRELDMDYGKMYNGYAALDPRNPCPNGWHVPVQEDWQVLSNFLGGDELAGGKLKSNGKSHLSQSFWTNSQISISNESGFSALPGGSRNPNGFFSGILFNEEIFPGFGHLGVWWSADAGSRLLYFHENNFYSNSIPHKTAAYCIRCIKD